MDNAELKRLYQALQGTDPLDDPENNPKYVPILQAQRERDPIVRLWGRISVANSESVSLLTGFRGNGKSTELRRLKAMLERNDCRVILVDMDDFLNISQPLEISDFLLSLMAALADGLKDTEDLEGLTEGYWERLCNFLQSEVKLENIDFQWKETDATAKLGFKLKNEPSFKRQIQTHMRGHLTRLVQQVRDYVAEAVVQLKARGTGPEQKVVMLVDSVEHIRGSGTQAQQVYDSIVNTFSDHAEKLELPGVHMVYTVPPFLVLHTNSASRTLGGHPIVMWPNIHVRNKQGGPDPAGLELMRKLVSHRHRGWDELIPQEQLDALSRASGGDIRDFFRLVRETALSLMLRRQAGDERPTVDQDMLDFVIGQLRTELRLMLTGDLKKRLEQVNELHALSPDGKEDIQPLTELLDGNLIMNYQNGEPWFDVHPLIIDQLADSPIIP